MDDSIIRQFFLEPSCPRQRQYEALRAVFVDGCSQKEVADRFDYTYQAFRQLVREFRQRFCEPDAPPFSTALDLADHAGQQP
jgi:hypothetical protein